MQYLKFIQVQIPEPIEEKNDAYKAGYNTITEIGTERIRRAGKKILEIQTKKLKQLKDEESFYGLNLIEILY